MKTRSIEDEQREFDAALPALIAKHTGEYALFYQGKPWGFYETRSEAYRQGLESFGLDVVFLISEVKNRRAETASLSWDLGVMFGE